MTCAKKGWWIDWTNDVKDGAVRQEVKRKATEKISVTEDAGDEMEGDLLWRPLKGASKRRRERFTFSNLGFYENNIKIKSLTCPVHIHTVKCKYYRFDHPCKRRG